MLRVSRTFKAKNAYVVASRLMALDGARVTKISRVPGRFAASLARGLASPGAEFGRYQTGPTPTGWDDQIAVVAHMRQPNRVKAAMRAGRKAYGYNLSFPSPWVIDILGKLDFDFVFMDNLDANLSVPGIDLYSIGPNDFAQSLGNPGQPDHPEVVKTMQEITRRIRQAGRTMQLDVMQGAWVSDMLLDAGRRILVDTS
jgi:HpcH/HpaI aldolase/citrate lyase family